MRMVKRYEYYIDGILQNVPIYPPSETVNMQLNGTSIIQPKTIGKHKANFKFWSIVQTPDPTIVYSNGEVVTDSGVSVTNTI